MTPPDLIPPLVRISDLVRQTLAGRAETLVMKPIRGFHRDSAYFLPSRKRHHGDLVARV